MRKRVATIVATAVLSGGIATAAELGSAEGANQAKTSALTFVKGTAKSPPTVWIANTSGQNQRKLGSGSSPLISPDGSMVAVARYATSGSALMIYSTSGSGKHGFFNLKNATAVPVAWSADSRYVAAEVFGSGQHWLKNSGVAIIDTTTMKSKMIARGAVDNASFKPSSVSGRADAVVYGITHSDSPSAKVNIFTAAPSGASKRQISHDGRSLNPLWTAKGIIFDREKIRGKNKYPAFQLWLRSGSHAVQLTHTKPGALQEGLIPIAASSNGARLLAAYVGEDTDYAWRVNVTAHHASKVKVGGKLVQPGSISSDGGRLLVDAGALEQPASKGMVEWVPFAGGSAHHLTHGAEPSWNS